MVVLANGRGGSRTAKGIVEEEGSDPVMPRPYPFSGGILGGPRLIQLGATLML